MKNIIASIVAISILFVCSLATGQDKKVVTLGDTITGNQEQPKVLYIVPWKQTKDNTILSQGLESRLSDVFNHVERSEHTRELEFFNTLAGAKEEPVKK